MYHIYTNTPLTDDQTVFTHCRCSAIEPYLPLYNFLPMGSQIKLVDMIDNKITGKYLLYNRVETGWELV
jgi:hypothetical protein